MEFYYIIGINCILLILCIMCCRRVMNDTNSNNNYVNEYRQSFISNRSSFNNNEETDYYEIYPSIVAVPIPSAPLIEIPRNEDPN